MNIMYYSQFEQDKIVHQILNQKEGVFLDIGASDGITFSNSYFFEKMGWKGLCIEPRKQAFDKLTQIRNCNYENILVTNVSETVTFQEINDYGSGLSGIVKYYHPKHNIRILKDAKNSDKICYKAQTHNIQDILDKYDMKSIDYCSIDTEGSEFEIIKGIDFNKTSIKIFTIENNYNDNEIKRYLQKKGYRFEKKIVCDDLYIKK